MNFETFTFVISFACFIVVMLALIYLIENPPK